MRISELYEAPACQCVGLESPQPVGLFSGEDVYVVGTGASSRVMDMRVLEGKNCVLLNKAPTAFPRLGPVAFTNHKKFVKQHPAVKYVCVKGRLRFDPNPEFTDNHVRWDDPGRYVFSYREPPWDRTSHFDESTLWKELDFYWNLYQGSVAIFAVQFALLAGARSITLVGCDCCNFDRRKYVMPAVKGRGPHNYKQYVAGLVKMKKEARDKFGVPLMQLGPFMGYGNEQDQYKEFETWNES